VPAQDDAGQRVIVESGGRMEQLTTDIDLE
jgi:hypothetical protein